jgi:hypothetical protein
MLLLFRRDPAEIPVSALAVIVIRGVMGEEAIGATSLDMFGEAFVGLDAIHWKLLSDPIVVEKDGSRSHRTRQS